MLGNSEVNGQDPPDTINTILVIIVMGLVGYNVVVGLTLLQRIQNFMQVMGWNYRTCLGMGIFFILVMIGLAGYRIWLWFDL